MQRGEIDLKKAFSKKEHTAIDALVERGFVPLTECMVEDARTMEGNRHRTFKIQGRYDVALVLKIADPEKAKAAAAIVAKRDEKRAAKREATATAQAAAAELTERDSKIAEIRAASQADFDKKVGELQSKLFEKANAEIAKVAAKYDKPAADEDPGAGADPKEPDAKTNANENPEEK